MKRGLGIFTCCNLHLDVTKWRKNTLTKENPEKIGCSIKIYDEKNICYTSLLLIVYLLSIVNKKLIFCSREFSSVERDMHYCMQRPEFEPRTSHLDEFTPQSYLTKKKSIFISLHFVFVYCFLKPNVLNKKYWKGGYFLN